MNDYAILAAKASTSLGDAPGPLLDRLLAIESGMGTIPPHRFNVEYKNVINRRACVIEHDAAFWEDIFPKYIETACLPRHPRSSWPFGWCRAPRRARPRRAEHWHIRRNGTRVASAARLGRPPPVRLGFTQLLRAIYNETGIAGPMSVVSTACTAGATSVVRGLHSLRAGLADVAICGGFDFFSELTHAGFNSLRAVTPDACRPFDVDRGGMLLGDGVGLLLLARSDDARFADLPSVGRISGYALGTDNYHDTSPEPSGRVLARLMQNAWSDAGRPAIGYVNAHGTGTTANDEAEANAISQFGQETGQKQIFVSSIKGHIGHTLGAAGAIEAIVTALALERGVAPPNFRLETPISVAGNVSFLKAPTQLAPGAGAISTSLAFGGHIAVLVIKPRGSELCHE